MSVNVCIQKILLLTRQILNCEVQNSYLKTIIFKLHRKVDLGVNTINYLNYYYTKEAEKFNSKQTSNTLIGFLASLDSIYLYINPVEDAKGGFLNQLLGLSEDNVKREFYFLLQSLDESIIEVQNILERALNTTFNELPDLGTLSPLPPTNNLPLSPTSPLNESFSNISETAQKSKIEPIKLTSNQQNLVQQSINSTLDTNTDQNASNSEPIKLSSDNQKIEDKSAEATSEITQAMNELNISEPAESQEKEVIAGQKSEHENSTISNKAEEQTLNNSSVDENPINKTNTDNSQHVPVNQNFVSTPIENNINSAIKANEPTSNSEQHIPITTGESNGIQNSNDTQSTAAIPSQPVNESTAPVQAPKVESSATESQVPSQVSNNNESATNLSTNPGIEKNENSQIPCSDLGQSGSQPNQSHISISNESNTIKSSDSVSVNAQTQAYSQNNVTPSNIPPVQQQPILNNQTQQPCNQNYPISSHTSPVQQQATFNNHTQQPCSPNTQQLSHPGSPIHISSPAQPVHPGSPHHISSPIQPIYPVSPNQQPYPCSPTQPIYPGSPNHITSPMQPIIPTSPSHFSAGSPNSLYSNQNQPPPLPHRPSPLPSPEQHYIPPPGSLFPQVNHFQNNNSYAPPYGSTSPIQQHFNPGYGGNPYQSPTQPQFRPNQPYHHGHTHSAQLPNFNDSLAFLPMNQYIRPNSPGYINPPQFGGYQQPSPQSQFPQMMMPSPDQYIQSRSGPQNQNNSNGDKRNMPMP